MLRELIKLANELDKRGLRKEADYLDGVIKLSGPMQIRYTDKEKRMYREQTKSSRFPQGERLGGTTELPSFQALPEQVKAMAAFVLSKIPYLGEALNTLDVFLALNKNPPDYEAALAGGFARALAASGIGNVPGFDLGMDAHEMHGLMADVSEEVRKQARAKNITAEKAKEMANPPQSGGSSAAAAIYP